MENSNASSITSKSTEKQKYLPMLKIEKYTNSATQQYLTN